MISPSKLFWGKAYKLCLCEAFPILMIIAFMLIMLMFTYVYHAYAYHRAYLIYMTHNMAKRLPETNIGAKLTYCCV